MYAQLTIGVIFIILGLLRLIGVDSDWVISKKSKTTLGDSLNLYMKKTGVVNCLFGIFIASMGIIERNKILNFYIFLIIYIFICILFIAYIICLNKKLTGYYFLQ